MKAYAEVLSTPSADTPGTAVLVHFDDKRYILGHISEGTQRALSERQARLGKVGEVFITGRTEWATTGGLVGLILTIGDQDKHKEANAPGVMVHGGENLLHSIVATRSFVLRTALKLKVDEIVEGREPFKDDNVTVTTLHVKPDTTESQTRRKRSFEDIRSREEKMEFLRKKVENMFWSAQRSIDVQGPEGAVDAAEVRRSKAAAYVNGSEDEGEAPNKRWRSEDDRAQIPRTPLHNRLPQSQPSPVALSYILLMHDHRGKFLPKVAIELGVPKGRDFRDLTDGKSVTTPSGRVVHPHEVMEPTRTGTGIAVCDIPSTSYIEDFVAQREWANPAEVQKRVGCFFWILGPRVSEDQRLLDFISRFPESGHVVSDPEVCPNSIKFQGAAKFLTRLNYLDPVLFPPLIASEEPTKLPLAGTITAKAGLVWNMEPVRNFDEERFVKPFDCRAAIESLGESFITVGSEIRDSLSQSPPQSEIFPGNDVEVYTLGTGSALPSRYRNVSAILLVIPETGSILLDCGENTLGQLRRMFSLAELNDRLRDIKVLYISHMHADHHLGAVAVLKAQSALIPKDRRTFVVGPYRFLTWLNEYSSVEDFGRERLTYVPCEQLRAESFGSSGAENHLLSAIDAESWETEHAHHCQSSFTTAVTFKNGFKVAYSGDTRPTEGFVRIGKDVTLLVHEATFDDELIGEAMAKKHSTISEAVQAGKYMNARVTCLTHFSQRYPKKPDLGVGGEGVIYAFDLMKFKVGEAGERWSRVARGVEEVYKDVEDEKGEEEQEALIAEMEVEAEAAKGKKNKDRKEKKKEKRGKKDGKENKAGEVML